MDVELIKPCVMASESSNKKPPPGNHRGHMMDQVFKPDPCHSGFKRKIGALSLREILHYQHTFKFLMSVRPFVRLIHEILMNEALTGHNDWRIQSSAIMILQTTAEAYLVSYFERCWFVCHPCQACHRNAKRHPPGTTHSA